MTHYDDLGVPAEASRADIHRAYLGLARRHHPDAGGDEAAMRRVNQAWGVLSDASRRRRYDLEHRLGRFEHRAPPLDDRELPDEDVLERRRGPVPLRYRIFETISLLVVLGCLTAALLSGLFGMVFTSTVLLGFAVFCLFLAGVFTVARVLMAMGFDAAQGEP